MLYYDEVWARDKEQLYHHFKNDSIFKSEYKLIDFKSDRNEVEVWIAKTDKRLEFLLETTLLSRYRFTFNDKTISKITTVDDDETDFDKWTARKDSLTSWINKNHPELSSFENDKTVEGSINYLNAIELYNNSK